MNAADKGLNPLESVLLRCFELCGRGTRRLSAFAKRDRRLGYEPKMWRWLGLEFSDMRRPLGVVRRPTPRETDEREPLLVDRVDHLGQRCFWIC